MATISTLAVNLIARTSVFERGMRRSRGSMKRFKAETVSTTARVASFAKGLLISGGAVFAIKSFTEAASRAQETMNLFNTVFAENAAATSKWADTFATDVGRSKTEVREWAATLQDTFVPLGFARDRAAELSKSLVELAVDVGSFKNIASDKEVIDAFTSAIVGNHRAVRAYGVVLTNATIEQEAYKAGIEKTFTDLTELEKVQLRYNLIMRSTIDAQGDAIKTAGNYANRVKKLKGQIADLKEKIGNDLIPTMTKLVAVVSKKIIPMLENLSSKWVKTVLKITLVIAEIVLLTKVFRLVSAAIVWMSAKLTLANAQYALLIAQNIILKALAGPAGWVAIAGGIAFATAAIVGLNIGIKEALDNFANVDDVVQKIANADLGDKVQTNLGGLDRAGLEGERLKTLKLITTEQNRIAFWGGKWGEDISENEAKLQKLQDRLTVIRVMGRKIARDENLKKGLELDAAALAGLDKFVVSLDKQIKTVEFGTIGAQLEDLRDMAANLSTKQFMKPFVEGLREAERLIAKIEKTKLFKSLSESLESLQLQVDNFGLTSLEATIKQFKEKAAGFGPDLSFEEKEFVRSIKEMESLLVELTRKQYLATLADEAESLKESLKGPAERLNDIRERLAEMLAEGFIDTDEFDKGLAKAKAAMAGRDPGFGRFSEIRSEFVDVAALNGADRQTEQEKTNRLLEEQNKTLKDLVNENRRESIT